MTLLELLKVVEIYGGKIEIRDGILNLVRPTEEFERSALDALLPELRAKRESVIAYYQDPNELTRREVDRREMIGFMYDADTWFGSQGVSGTHPEVKAAVSVVYSAYVMGDLETVQLAVAEFKVVVRNLVRPNIEITPEMAARDIEDNDANPNP